MFGLSLALYGKITAKAGKNVQAVLKRRLDKSSRFTDWSRRPLSEPQLVYALGDVTHLRRYVSTSTDARERQWRHFYYAQDTWRATPRRAPRARPPT